MLRRRIPIGLVGLAISANVSLAQTNGTFLITFDGVVTPQHPTMTVGIWAAWDEPPQEYIFGAANYDLEAGEGEFVSGTLKLGREPPNLLGVLSGRKVIGAAIGQVFLPGVCCKPENSILLATYQWTTTDFTPRVVNFETSNTVGFILLNRTTGERTHLYPHEFTHGRAQFVIPASGPIGLLSGWMVLAATRRRR